MNAYLSLCAAFLVVFATVSATPLPKTRSGNSVDDKMYEHFQNETDVEKILDEALEWKDAVKQHEHFEFLKEVAGSTDNPKQKFAQKILDAAQKRFDNLLAQLEYPQQVGVDRYIESMYEMQTKNMVSDATILDILQRIAEMKEKMEAQAKQQGQNVEAPQHSCPSKQQRNNEQQAAEPNTAPVEAQVAQQDQINQEESSQIVASVDEATTVEKED